MSDSHSTPGYAFYWKIWLVLLALTCVMLFVDGAAMPASVLMGCVLVAMVVKSGLIIAYFMHLWQENRAMIATVLIGIVFTCLAMWFLFEVDARWVNSSLP